MAADTRPYKSKEQDGQGNEIILRDQQLVEQASQTTMASGEYFEIVDVDGRMAKIPKANMVDIVREALGSLLNGLTDQTTVTKVPSLNGNTLGASTVATLASVLGDNTGNKTFKGPITISRTEICPLFIKRLVSGGNPAIGFVYNDDYNNEHLFYFGIETNGNKLYIQQLVNGVAGEKIFITETIP